MKNQPRWVCTQCKGSYQLMGAGDLKLGRMRSRIPEGELPRVLAYFETRKNKIKTEEAMVCIMASSAV